jgi:hypothetical protein
VRVLLGPNIGISDYEKMRWTVVNTRQVLIR